MNRIFSFAAFFVVTAIASLPALALVPYHWGVLSQGTSYAVTTSGSPCDKMSTDIPTNIIDLAAACSSSYSGSGQTWANLEGDTNGDYHLGADSSATATDPTFSGSAGVAGAKFTMDGGDYFTSKQVTTPAVMYNLHRKTGGTNQWYIGWVFKSGTDASMNLWGRGWAGNTYGFFALRTATNINYYSDVAGATPNTGNRGYDFGTTLQCAVISVDMEATTNNFKYWHNTTTGTTINKTWNSDNNNPTYNFYIGTSINSAGVLQSIMTNGSEYYEFSVGTGVLSDSDVAKMFARWEARNGIDCTP